MWDVPSLPDQTKPGQVEACGSRLFIQHKYGPIRQDSHVRVPAAVGDHFRPQPRLPNQTHSLHAGWRWSKQKDGSSKLRMDGHHANTAGEYLGACVFYEVLFGESVVGDTFVPPGLDPAYAKFLQETAHQAVAE